MTKAKGPLFDVHFRRRREGITDYATRLALLKSQLPRAVVRKSNRLILVQITSYAPEGDCTVCQASSKELSKHGFEGKCNTPSAYLTGLLAGKKALAKGVKTAVADIGRQTATKGGLLFAAVKGIADSGVKISLGGEITPSDERVQGTHLKQGAKEKFEQARKNITGANE
ncbi:MAG: 50S ribosomal protein L18 [Candidatus Micrarchaeota archaeon]